MTRWRPSTTPRSKPGTRPTAVGSARGTLEQVREPIRELLEQQRHEAAMAAFVSRMREKVAVTVLLDPPRVDVQTAAHDPTFGPDGAPIQILEFSDFQ